MIAFIVLTWYNILHYNMHTVCSKSWKNPQVRLFTVGIRCLTIRRARNALLLFEVPTTSKLPRSEESEAKVGSSGYEGNNYHGQAEGQQELGEHVGPHCWGGVVVIRRHMCEFCFVVVLLGQYRTAYFANVTGGRWERWTWHTYGDVDSSTRQRPLFREAELVKERSIGQGLYRALIVFAKICPSNKHINDTSKVCI